MSITKVSVECSLCGAENEVSSQESSIGCIVCGANIVIGDHLSCSPVLSENEEVCDLDNFDEIDDFSDYDDLDSIKVIKESADGDNIIVIDEDSNLDEENTSGLDHMQEILVPIEELNMDYSQLPYIEAIKQVKIRPLNISDSLYDYQIIDAKKLLARMTYLLKKARKNGVLSLDDELSIEPNPILRFALELAIDGTEPNTILEIMQIKKEWFKKKYLHCSLSPKKVTFIDRVMFDFDFIIEGMMSLQDGSNVSDLYEKCKETNTIFDIKFKNEKEYEEAHESYLKYNDTYLLLEDEKTKDIEELLNIIDEDGDALEEARPLINQLALYKTKNIDKLLDIFNEKRDALQDIEMLVLEDPTALAERLLAYATLAREYGIIAACFNSSLQDPNTLIRHILQKILRDWSPVDVKKYAQEYKVQAISNAKKYHNEDFIFLYEREIDVILCMCLAIMAGDSPRMLKLKVFGFYPEITNFCLD